MNPRVKVIKQLVADGLYVVEEAAIVNAMALRAIVQRELPDVTFRCAPRVAPVVRSFRPHRGARSFRLSRAQRRRLHAHPPTSRPIRIA
jgi:hypothetical protein